MKNGLEDGDGSMEPPPPKRIKLEEDLNEEGGLLSQNLKKHGRGGYRGKKSKTTIEERALVLLNDDRISAVDPQQVLCRMCGNWVKLFKHTDFSPANWRTHADKCEPRSGWKSRIRADPSAALTLTIPSLKSARTAPAAESVSPTSNHIPPSAKASTSKGTEAPLGTPVSDVNSKESLDPNTLPSARRPMSSTVERQKVLEDDERCKNPGPHSVFCKMCSQTIKLHNTREYDLWNWLRHAEKCEVRNNWVESGSTTLHAPNAASEVPSTKDNESTLNDVLTHETCTVHDDSGASTAHFNPFPETCHTNPGQSEAPKRPAATAMPAQNVTRKRRKQSVSGVSSDSTRQPCETHNLRFIADPNSASNRTEELQPFGVGRTALAQAEQRDETLGESSAPADLAKESLLDISVNQSISAPFIKTEPGDMEGILYYAQGQDAEAEGLSASASTGARRRKGRSAEERRQALLADPRLGEVLPNAVYCTMCKKWIKLYREVEYVESNWTRHAERCSLRVAAKNASKKVIPTPLISISAPNPTSPSKRSPVKSNAERLHDLQADSRIETVEPHQVLCGICKQWIKLQSYRDYDIWNWRKHVPLCEQRHSGSNPESSRVLPRRQSPVLLRSDQKRSLRSIKVEETEAGPSSVSTGTTRLTAPPKISSSTQAKRESTAEERRAELERDGRCENIEAQRVTCKICHRVVGLHVKRDYSLSNWYKHIASCGKKVESPGKVALKTPLTAIGGLRTAEASSSVQTAPIAVSREEAQDSNDAPSPMPALEEIQYAASAPPHASRAGKSNARERREKLAADPRVEAVEVNRIQCKLCQHWLKLNEFMDFAPYNWFKHIERCEVRASLKDKGMSDTPIVVKEEETQTPEIRVSDELSISAGGGSHKRTTPSERLARMQADPRIKTIEKHRARCGLCDKWVKLQNKTEYDPHNWFAHVKKCEMRSDAPPVTPSSVALSVEKQEPEPSPMINGDSDSGSLIGRTGTSTVLSRRALLLNDIRSAAVEPQRVLCKICNQWIKLRDGKEYVPYNWFKHKRKCEKRHGLPQTSNLPFESGASSPSHIKEIIKKEPIPGDLGLYVGDQRKMTDEERAAQLRADPRLGDVEPGRVFCKMCNSWIKLNMSTGYLRGNWMRHEQRCKGRADWQGATPDIPDEPPELSAVEIIDLEIDSAGGNHFGYIELGRLIGKFEPTVSSTDYGNPPEAKAAPEIVKQPPTWSIPTLRARPNTSRVNSPAPTPPTHNSLKTVDTGKRMHRSEQVRKDELESDRRTKIVLPDKILCAMCDRWIQMRRDVAYSPQNWLKHAGICEQRTGRMKKEKTEDASDTLNLIVPETAEEFIPYNARKRLDEQQSDFNPPSLKLVDWGQVVTSDDDDDDERINTDAVKMPGRGEASTMKSPSTSTPSQAPSVSGNPSATGVPNAIDTSKLSVPTPLAAVHANAFDMKGIPITVSGPMGMRKPMSNSPPQVAPFTSVPLPFYRAAYSPHMVQHGFQANRGGTPPNSGSLQNGGPHSQRALPFVVPAASMLPHLLPRPVLVPISHTSRQGSGTASPFRLPATPPLPPPVGLSKPNGALPTPPSTGPTTTGNTPNGVTKGHTSAARSAAPLPVHISRLPAAEASSVAVPTPIRSIFGYSPMIAQPQMSKSSVSPTDSAPLSKKADYGPTAPGVLQLAPESNHGSTVQAVLQLAPDHVASPESEKAKPEKAKTASGMAPNGVLQLAPSTGTPMDKEAGLKEAPFTPNPKVPIENPKTQRDASTIEVLQLAPNLKVSPKVEPERTVVPAEERGDGHDKDASAGTERMQDAMLVKA